MCFIIKRLIFCSLLMGDLNFLMHGRPDFSDFISDSDTMVYIPIPGISYIYDDISSGDY